MIVFFITLTEIVTEKEQKLRLAMRLMGLKNAAYWIVWQIVITIIAFLATLVQIASGAACGFGVFTNTDFFVSFFMYFIFTIAAVEMGFFMSTLIGRVETAQTVSYGIILIGFVFQSFLSFSYAYFIQLFYDPNASAAVKLFRILLQFYPPYNFCKIFSDVSNLLIFLSSLINILFVTRWLIFPRAPSMEILLSCRAATFISVTSSMTFPFKVVQLLQSQSTLCCYCS